MIFIGIWLQAVPFLLLGTIISSTLTAFLKPQALARFLPRQTALAVVVAGLAGIALPACECASVPTTKSLVRQAYRQPQPSPLWWLPRPSIRSS